jgi:CCR4-NOT transcriptional complex subunit CAF120
VTGTPLIDLNHNTKKRQEASSDGLTAYIDHREKEKAKAKMNRNTAAMQAEIDRRMMAAQQRQMMEVQQHMGQQASLAPSVYGAPAMAGSPSVYQQTFAYSSPDLMQHMYQQSGYFPEPAISPGIPQGMQQGWATPSPQPMQGPYFAPQQAHMQQRQAVAQQQTYTQPYGASFDQAQAAARFAHQQGQQFRRG